MQVGDVMAFSSKDYVVRQILYRTKTDRAQTLSEKICKRTEKRRVFYVVERKGKQYWVKEYVVPTKAGYNADYEYKELMRLSQPSYIDCNSIAAVSVFGLEKNRILEEYCPEHKKITECRKLLTKDDKALLVSLINLWLAEHSITGYDFSACNTLVRKEGGVMSVKLIDFEQCKHGKAYWRKYFISKI